MCYTVRMLKKPTNAQQKGPYSQCWPSNPCQLYLGGATSYICYFLYLGVCCIIQRQVPGGMLCSSGQGKRQSNLYTLVMWTHAPCWPHRGYRMQRSLPTCTQNGIDEPPSMLQHIISHGAAWPAGAAAPVSQGPASAHAAHQPQQQQKQQQQKQQLELQQLLPW